MPPFLEGEAGPLERVWIEEERTAGSRFYFKLAECRWVIHSYYKCNQWVARQRDKRTYNDWGRGYPFAKNMVNGNQASWREAVQRHADFHRVSAIAKVYSLHVYDAKTVECDVYLHNLEAVIPKKIEITTKRGKIGYPDMPKTKQYKYYQKYVYSCLNKISNDLFAGLPCERIFLNGIIHETGESEPVLSLFMERASIGNKSAQ